MFRVLASRHVPKTAMVVEHECAYIEDEGQLLKAEAWLDRGQYSIWWRKVPPSVKDIEFLLAVSKEGYVPHEPPIDVEDFREWPNAVKRARQPMKTASRSA